ncbi:hypothetical protein [Streptomyces sp. MBT84]|uniref:hypothetical protein n=1 Tax=Streptomyces sp. MBT84 TaxID=1488414 RepID=UPI001C6DD821|nr:hypothetical protein [Streptomyces sp. MBT84]
MVADAAHAMPADLGRGARTSILDAEALPRAVAENGPAELSATQSAYGLRTPP